MRIFDFAVVANWDDRLDVLAELAEPERWVYRALPSTQRLPILDSYMRHTFMRLVDERKVLETESAACFNTGLLTPGQEEIFGLFSVSDHFDETQPVSPQNKKWFLRGWARGGDRQLIPFSSLPRLASYWEEPSELLFNPHLHVELNLDHIARDNLARFPEELGGNLDRDGIPTDLAALSTGEAEELADEGVPASPPTRDVPLSTRNALDGAMKDSVRLAQRSYRIAVPQFHHGRFSSSCRSTSEIRQGPTLRSRSNVMETGIVRRPCSIPTGRTDMLVY